MTDMLFEIHRGIGYLVAVVVLVTALMAFGRARDAREFSRGPYAFALILLDIQVLLGLVFYGIEQYWEADPLLAYVHPLLALAALGVGHALVGRARKQRMAPDAHRTAGQGLLGALFLALTAVVVASLGGLGFALG